MWVDLFKIACAEKDKLDPNNEEDAFYKQGNISERGRMSHLKEHSFFLLSLLPNGAASLNINTVLITGKSTGCRSSLRVPLW